MPLRYLFLAPGVRLLSSLPMIRRKSFRLRLRASTLLLGPRTLIVGVLNITPDSFSDGGKFFDVQKAIERAVAMERDGADLIDIGAESTRPGAECVSVEEELRRLLPVLDALRRLVKIPISIDTQKAEVAEAVLDAGAQMINDISGLKHDSRLAEAAAKHGVPLVLMHLHGEPGTMQKGPFARNVVQDVAKGLRQSIAKARKAGVAKSQIILDPGIGFGKSHAQNYELLQKLPQLAALGYPLLVGTSRKGFLGETLARDGKPAPPEDRIWGTAATVAASILNGAHIVRVHDVAEMVQVARIADCIVNPKLRVR
ncbi:MAG: dihydropteroate synthase [Candidatus Acidiferrum sp.]